MSKHDDGGPAFPMPAGASAYDGRPNHSHGPVGGMSLRDWFAGMALQGMLAGTPPKLLAQIAESAHARGENSNDLLALHAYLIADSLIAARAAGGGDE